MQPDVNLHLRRLTELQGDVAVLHRIVEGTAHVLLAVGGPGTVRRPKKN